MKIKTPTILLLTLITLTTLNIAILQLISMRPLIATSSAK